MRPGVFDTRQWSNETVISYSILNSSDQPVEIVPPQIQITGRTATKKKKQGKGIISDQLETGRCRRCPRAIRLRRCWILLVRRRVAHASFHRVGLVSRKRLYFADQRVSFCQGIFIQPLGHVENAGHGLRGHMLRRILLLCRWFGVDEERSFNQNIACVARDAHEPNTKIRAQQRLEGCAKLQCKIIPAISTSFEKRSSEFVNGCRKRDRHTCA